MRANIQLSDEAEEKNKYRRAEILELDFKELSLEMIPIVCELFSKALESHLVTKFHKTVVGVQVAEKDPGDDSTSI